MYKRVIRISQPLNIVIMEQLIKKAPNPVLIEKSSPVTDFSTLEQFLIPQLLRTMSELNGVGISAVQIGSLRQVFIYRDSKYEFHTVCNPEIISCGKKKVSLIEGCLSVDNVLYDIMRPNRIDVKYQTVDGSPVEKTLRDMDARIFQHEYDHLQGIMMSVRSGCSEALLDAMMKHDNDQIITVKFDLIDVEAGSFTETYINASLFRFKTDDDYTMTITDLKELIDKDFPIKNIDLVSIPL